MQVAGRLAPSSCPTTIGSHCDHVQCACFSTPCACCSMPVPVRSASCLWALLRAHAVLAADPDCLAAMLGSTDGSTGGREHRQSKERGSLWTVSTRRACFNSCMQAEAVGHCMASSSECLWGQRTRTGGQAQPSCCAFSPKRMNYLSSFPHLLHHCSRRPYRQAASSPSLHCRRLRALPHSLLSALLGGG